MMGTRMSVKRRAYSSVGVERRGGVVWRREESEWGGVVWCGEKRGGRGGGGEVEAQGKEERKD